MTNKTKLTASKSFVLLSSFFLIGLYIYSAISFYNEYTWWNSAGSIILFILLLWLCVTATSALLVITQKGKSNLKITKTVITVFILYNFLLWGGTLFAEFIAGWNKNHAAFFGIILSSILYAAIAFTLITRIFKKSFMRKTLCIALVVALVLSSGIMTLFFLFKDEYYYKRQLENANSMDIDFDSITSQQLTVTKSEKKKCADWFNENIINAGKNDKIPAYAFSADGVELHNSLEDWTFSIGETSTAGAYLAGGQTTFITLTNETLGLKATVKATLYEALATCEWTVFIKNISTENSCEITNFKALNSFFDVGEDALLYYSTGSDCSADDFTLNKVSLSEIKATRFAGTNGRSSVDYMPYFNICGDTSFVMSVGWTGQWRASYSLLRGSLFVEVCQENFNAYLTPNEEVRSPLVSISFYDGANAFKGFNTLRKWQMSLSPDVSEPQVFYCYSNEQDYSTTTDNIDAMLKLADFDALWIDAAWYNLTHGKWYNSVGSWSDYDANKHIFPDGIKAVGKYANEKNLDLLLWYEPERVTKGSELYKIAKENDGWLLSGGDYLWNLANDDAFRYLCAYISTSIKDIGVDIYRQDFNTDALYYWNWGDENLYDGRTGITENHYVTNLYAYLDYLLQANYGLLIDNCASGGRRLDTEMTRRSVALHRSDYINENEATQSMTYGVSFFVPANGIILQLDDEYSARSWMTALNNVMVYNEENVEIYEDFRKLHNTIYKYWFENCFPLTPQNYNTDEWLAMQYGDGGDGFAIIYKRENVNENEFTLIMNGLSEKKKYVLTDYDNPKKSLGTFTGKQLMSQGVVLKIEETPKATVVLYKAK